MQKSIRTRLTAAFIGLAALPLLLAGGTLAWRSFQIQQREALVAQMQSARMLATEIRTFIEGRLAEMELLVRMEGLEDKSAMRIGEVLTALVSHRPDIAEAVWLDAEGRERARESHLEVVTAAELRDRSGWEALRWVREQGRAWFGPVRFESQTGEPLMTVVVPARSPRGATLGALAVDLRLKKVWERVAAPDLSGQTLMVVDAQGWVVAHRNPSLVLRGTRIVPPTAPGLSQGIDGGAVLAAPELLVFGSQRLVVLAERSLWQALDLALQTVLVVAVVILAALSAAVGLVMLAQRSILKPLHGLAVVAGQIGDGDLNRLAPVESGDEIGTLAVAFNTMTARLRRSLHSLEERIAEQRLTQAALLRSQEELRQAKADLERRVAERTLDLSQAQQQLAEAIESISEGFALFDAEDRLALCNRRLREFYPALEPQLQPGTPFRALMEASAATGLVANTDRDGAAWVAWRVEQRHLPERSHIQRLHCGRWLLVNERRTASGQTVGIYTDITELKRGEQALRAATVEAEQATRTKSEFLANMSHELRTPLNAIIGFSDTILAEIFGPIGNPRYREYLGHIHHSGHHLLDLINDILDLSKVEAGKVELEYLPIDVAVLVEGCLTMLGERASAVGLTLSARIEGEPLILWGDERRLRQVLINLLSNAIKFTPEGGSVTVHAAARPEGMVALTVADSGIGIAAEDIAKVLEPFGQVESAQSRKHQGTGLGLPLARNLVQLHGGTFHLSSQPGEGTTIVLTLPAAGHEARQAAGSAPFPESARQSPDGRHIA